MTREGNQQSNAYFALAIVLLMILCVGLLVAVMKGSLNHELSSAAKKSRINKTQNVNKLPILSDTLKVKNATRTTTATTTTTTTTTPTTTTTTTEIFVTDIATEASTIISSPIWHNSRLSETVLPVHYDLTLWPNVTLNKFTGRVVITTRLAEATDVLILHSVMLNITEVVLTRASDWSEVRVVESFAYLPNEYWILKTENVLLPDTYRLHFRYEGDLSDDLTGLYRSSYINSITSKARYLVASKFQPTYARRAFPCFDEPKFKSTFTVTVIHDSDYISLSNMPVQEVKPFADHQGISVTKFHKSVPMVTYLVSVMVCDFNYTSTKTPRGTEIRIYSSPDKVHKTKYALRIGARMLHFFETYLNFTYPLTKQDMVAVPYLASEAMEHWGLVTYRESNLLFDDSESSLENKERIAEIIAHELAHMWFGNLVTIFWWNELWLHEGFASYLEYKGVNEVEPEWNVMEWFVTDDLQPTLQIDSSINSHPLSQPYDVNGSITKYFDIIAYSKGASILRMLEYVIGPQNFRLGMTRFLHRYAFKNVRNEDLWQSFHYTDEKTNETLHEIMSTWIKEVGYPCVNVSIDPEDPNKATITQTRFLKNPAIFDYLEYQKNVTLTEKLWHIPLSYETSSRVSGMKWISAQSKQTIQLPLFGAEWIKFNINQTGYYIVNYDHQQWKNLVEALRTDPEVFGAIDRSNLLFDAFELAEAGYINYDIPLSMALYLKNENNAVPWETASKAFMSLFRLLEFTNVNPLIRSYVRELTESLYSHFGWDHTTTHSESLLQSVILGLACYSGNKECLTEATSRFQDWINGEELSINLRPLIYRYGMAEIGREEHWNYMWNRYLIEGSGHEKRKLLYGLAHVREPWLIKRYLDLTLDESKIKMQDAYFIYTYLTASSLGREFLWTFIRANWPHLTEKFSSNRRYLGKLLIKISKHLTTEWEYEEMQEFFRQHPNAIGWQKSENQCLEIITNNIHWLNRYQSPVEKWLLTKGYKPWHDYRLPFHIRPLHYDLRLRPQLPGNYYSGEVTITVSMQSSTNIVILHASKLNISSTSIWKVVDGRTLNIKNTFAYKPNEFWVIQLEDSMIAFSEYRLHFQFNARYSTSLTGFYKSFYTDFQTGETKTLAVSQFHPIYARTVFPSFDEPTFKSTFSISIYHDPKYVALSNMPAKEMEELDDGQILTKFQKSVPMATYLVCFVICDFVYRESYTEGGTRFRIYSASDKINQTEYALDIGVQILTYYEKYLDIRYPLPKQDLIALPDLGGVAMENWGLITFKEASLFNDEESSSYDIFRTSVIIAHELAHMWFGNLVTMEWWDDVWLNEGFANYLEYKSLETIRPDWDMMEQFLLEEVHRVLITDATQSSHPIIQSIGHPREIAEYFDYISYSKGAAILRMLEFFLSKEYFQEGLSLYLKTYHHRTVKTEDLWRELSTITREGLDISEIMDTWTKQKGYPFVTLKRDPNDRTVFIAKQQRFLLDPDTESSEVTHHGYIWKIPLSYYTSEMDDVKVIWINSDNEVTFQVRLDDPDNSWVKFNVNSSGYYLVNYEDDDWSRLGDILRNNLEIFTPSDRANLLSDAFLLARAGHMPYGLALDLTAYLKEEKHLVPWSIAKKQLHYISRLLQESIEAHELIQEYINVLTHDILLNLTWSDEGNHLEKRLRTYIIDLACDNGNKLCLEEASKRLTLWINGQTIPPNLRTLVYRYGMWHGGNDTVWEYMFQQYVTDSYNTHSKRLLYGLAFTKNEHLITRYLNHTMNNTLIRKQDVYTVLRYLAANPIARPFVWKFIREKWKDLIGRFSTKSTDFGRLVRNVCSYFDTDEHLQEMIKFFKVISSDRASRRARQEAVTNVLNNIHWLKKYKAAVTDWLRTKPN